MCDFFKRDEYKKKNMYISTHYFHLLYFLKENQNMKDLFNSHLHQSMIHELLSENDIILLLDSPYFDIHYKYNTKKYEKNLIKSIKNNIYENNRHLSNIEEVYLLNEKLEKINTPTEPTIKRKKKIYKPIFLHNDLSSESSSSEISENDFILEDYQSLSSEDNDFYAFTNPIHNFSSDSNSESESDNEHIHQPGILLHHPDEDNYFNQNQSGNLNITLLNDVFSTPYDDNAINSETCKFPYINPVQDLLYHGRGNIEKQYIVDDLRYYSLDSSSPNRVENGNRVKELFNINNQNEPIQTIYFSGNIDVPQLLETHQKENDEAHLIDHISKLNESIDNYKKVGNIENKYDDNENKEIEKINKKHLFTYFSSSKSTNYKKYEDSNILILACMKKMDKLAYFLLTHFKDIHMNYTNKNGDNALLLACENGLFETSKYLLEEKDIKVNIFGTEEENSKEHLLEICCRNQLGVQALQILHNQDFKKYIIQHRRSSSYNHIIEKALGYACKNNMISVIQTILENYKLDASRLNTYHNNPLHWCAFHLNSEAISLLLKYKDIDIDRSYEKGVCKSMSYLELLCDRGLEKNIFELLKNKQYDLKENNDTKSPFFFACKSGLTNVALKLLELNDYKVKFEVRENKSHKNSLYYACLKNMNEVIKIILNMENINENVLNSMDDNNQNTPLLLCIKNKNEKRALQILKLKYEKKINVNVYQNNDKNKNALYYAVEHNLKHVIKLLLNDKISYTPTLLKIFSKLLTSKDKEKYIKILNSYKNTTNNCNICFENHYTDSIHKNDLKEDINSENYLVKCESCVGLFHIQCLSTYFKSTHTKKCPYCRKKGNFFLTK